jgi:hypothetical protein
MSSSQGTCCDLCLLAQQQQAWAHDCNHLQAEGRMSAAWHLASFPRHTPGVISNAELKQRRHCTATRPKVSPKDAGKSACDPPLVTCNQNLREATPGIHVPLPQHHPVSGTALHEGEGSQRAPCGLICSDADYQRLPPCAHQLQPPSCWTLSKTCGSALGRLSPESVGRTAAANLHPGRHAGAREVLKPAGQHTRALAYKTCATHEQIQPL